MTKVNIVVDVSVIRKILADYKNSPVENLSSEFLSFIIEARKINDEISKEESEMKVEIFVSDGTSRVEPIRIIRMLTGWGLKEAKDFYDGFCEFDEEGKFANNPKSFFLNLGVLDLMQSYSSNSVRVEYEGNVI